MKTEEEVLSAEIGTCYRASNSFDPTTINVEGGTVEAIFATDTPVRTWQPKLGEYWEVLGFEPGMVNLTRFNTSAPVLKNHNRYDGDAHLGTIISSELKGKTLVGTMRFDLEDGPGNKEFGKISRGFIKSVSIGYRVTKVREIGEKDGLPIYLATEWEPFEISTVTIPADIKASIREESGQRNEVQIIKHKKENMPEVVVATEPVALTEDQKRALIDTAKKEGQEAERTRISEIQKLAERSRMDTDFVVKHIQENTTVEKVRELVLDKLTEKQPKIIVGARGDGGWKGQGERGAAISDAILYRMDPKGNSAVVEAGGAKEFVNMTLRDLVDDVLVQNGLSTTGSNLERAQRAMNFGLSQRANGTMSGSDLPSIFLNVMNKTLRKDYQFETGKWKPLTYDQPASNLRNSPSVNLGEFGALQKVLEGEEYKNMAVSDNYENFQVYKFGNNVGITLEMIINDDLGAMNRIMYGIARSQAFTEDELVWKLFTDAAITMRDGNAVFHSSHANLATGAIMSATTLNELYLLLRNQTGLGGKVLDLTPKYIVCGPANEFLVSQLTSSNYTPAKTSDVMPGYLKALTPIVTSYITGNAFFVACDPNAIDTIRTGGLVGHPSFQIDEHIEWKNDSYVFHARKFFGASYTDYRGFAKNPGQ